MVEESLSVRQAPRVTPLDGFMMGTRSGSVDPGILTFLSRQSQLDGEDIDKVLDQGSGLLGISGLSSDLCDILEGIRHCYQTANLAFVMYVHRLLAIGGMAAVLGGMDALVSTARVGENSADVRAAACRGLGFLGIRLDGQVNAQRTLGADVSTADSCVRVP